MKSPSRSRSRNGTVARATLTRKSTHKNKDKHENKRRYVRRKRCEKRRKSRSRALRGSIPVWTHPRRLSARARLRSFRRSKPLESRRRIIVLEVAQRRRRQTVRDAAAHCLVAKRRLLRLAAVTARRRRNKYALIRGKQWQELWESRGRLVHRVYLLCYF